MKRGGIKKTSPSCYSGFLSQKIESDWETLGESARASELLSLLNRKVECGGSAEVRDILKFQLRRCRWWSHRWHRERR